MTEPIVLPSNAGTVPAASKPVIQKDTTARSEARAAAHSSRQARMEVRRATSARRRFERSEARRFTRRSRNRKAAWLVVAGIVVTLAIVLGVAVYSPILALRTITVEGATSISDSELEKAVDGQIGTPLALLDFDRITRELGAFPLIRSYVTETIPPDTLVIHVVEREPIGVVRSGSAWDLVDPAGVVVSSSTSRPKNMPVIRVDGPPTSSAGFAAVAEVLVALPQKLRRQVNSITANTQDDVAFVLDGTGSRVDQKVEWGNAERSEFKARVLQGLLKNNDRSEAKIYDVSSPDAASTRAD